MDDNKTSFEDKLAQLEKIVSDMENGSVPLEQMVDLYEKGQKLYKDCNEILSSFERRISEVTKLD